jgi:hypothetical protein
MLTLEQAAAIAKTLLATVHSCPCEVPVSAATPWVLGWIFVCTFPEPPRDRLIGLPMSCLVDQETGKAIPIRHADAFELEQYRRHRRIRGQVPYPTILRFDRWCESTGLDEPLSDEELWATFDASAGALHSQLQAYSDIPAHQLPDLLTWIKLGHPTCVGSPDEASRVALIESVRKLSVLFSASAHPVRRR